MRLFKTLAVLATVLAQPLAAQDKAVVELYTSQGCSSCPPADAILADLAKRSDVIALAFHVDYWDYLGWADDLASPVYTQRQHAYAAAKNSRRVYTPQVIVGGTDHAVGSRAMQVMDLVQRHAATTNPVSVSLDRSGSTLRITAEARGNLNTNTVVQVVRYTPSTTRDIRRGENAGRTINYVNTVTELSTAGTWNTREPLQLQVSASGSDPVVVLVQQGTNGPILGAAELR